MQPSKGFVSVPQPHYCQYEIQIRQKNKLSRGPHKLAQNKYSFIGTGSSHSENPVAILDQEPSKIKRKHFKNLKNHSYKQREWNDKMLVRKREVPKGQRKHKRGKLIKLNYSPKTEKIKKSYREFRFRTKPSGNFNSVVIQSPPKKLENEENNNGKFSRQKRQTKDKARVKNENIPAKGKQLNDVKEVVANSVKKRGFNIKNIFQYFRLSKVLLL